MTQNHERIDDAAPSRRRGAQPGNQNALRHGRRSRAAILARKLSVARLKALAHAVVALDMLREKHRHRVAPLRADQIELLRRYDRQLLDLVPEAARASAVNEEGVPAIH